MRQLILAVTATLTFLTGAAALILAAYFVLAAPARAADMPLGLAPPPAAVLVAPSGVCTIASPAGYVEVFKEPRGEFSGTLPAGMIVEVIDWPYSDRTDLWVRIKPPRENHYYGWVATASFVCY